jgi:hypothetical protein
VDRVVVVGGGRASYELRAARCGPRVRGAWKRELWTSKALVQLQLHSIAASNGYMDKKFHQKHGHQ